MAFKFEQVLYTLGGLFAAVAIIYFAWEYLVILPRISKSALLLLLILVFYFLNKHYSERDV